MSNREAIERLYRSFVAHDPDPALFPFNDDSVWVEPSGNARSGVFRGVREIAKHVAYCRDLCDGTWSTDVMEILAGEEYVVVVDRALALRNGEALDMMVNTVFTMTGGIITEMRVLPSDAAAWNTFWS